MPQQIPFEDLARRVVAGEAEAARTLVDRFEPAIRRAVRIHLRDRRLRRLFDSMDVCQSVLGNFFVRAAHGLLDLSNPEQLARLLVDMARTKVVDYARRQRAARRDIRRHEGAAALQTTPSQESSASQHVAGAELLEEFRKRLTAEELHLAELRKQGRNWGQIAAELGGTPEALRKQLDRAVDRVSAQMEMGPAQD